MEDDDTSSTGRKGPSTLTLTFTGIIAIAGLIGSGIASYNALMAEIVIFKQHMIYQDRVNEDFRVSVRELRQEQKEQATEAREQAGIFGEKIDRLFWSLKGK